MSYNFWNKVHYRSVNMNTPSTKLQLIEYSFGKWNTHSSSAHLIEEDVWFRKNQSNYYSYVIIPFSKNDPMVDKSQIYFIWLQVSYCILNISSFCIIFLHGVNDFYNSDILLWVNGNTQNIERITYEEWRKMYAFTRAYLGIARSNEGKKHQHDIRVIA